MIMRLVLPRYEKVHFLSGICSLFLRKEDEVHYIGGAEILPPPLEGEREAYCIRMLDGVHAERAEKGADRTQPAAGCITKQKSLITQGSE